MSKINIISHNFTGNSLVIAYTGPEGFKQKIVESSHPNWRQIRELYKKGKVAEIVPLFDVRQAINAKFGGKFVVKGDSVTFNGEPIKGYLFDRILFFMREGLQYGRLVKFAENLFKNPSTEARDQLYKFLEHKNMPITDDGCFLAYKGVQGDYYSITGGDIQVIKGKVNSRGQIYNAVGEEIEVKRGDVCGDVRVGCASGLHVGSYEYANGFKNDGRLMVVKVNPRDVVSVPSDCSFQKCRACAYEVIAEDGQKLHEVKNANYDKVAKIRYHNRRDASGRFKKADKFSRNSLGRFCS